MKLSIWRQFSSNHSADFTLVGTFDSAEAAAQAADVVRDAMQRIVDWYAENEPVRQAVLDLIQREPTPVEQEIATIYGVEQETAVDFLANTNSTEHFVTIYRNHVFVTNASVQTDNGPVLFDGLLETLGGTVTRDIEAGDAILVSVAFHLSDQTRLSGLLSEASILHEEGMRVFPWLVYHVEHEDAEKVLQDANHLIRTLTTAIYNMDMYKTTLLMAIHDVGVHYASGGGVRMVDGKLQLRRLHFYKLSVGLPAMIRWLESKGCTDITFSIEQAEWDIPEDDA